MDERKETVNHEEKSSNYELKSKAVEDLISDETPEYSQEELYQYRKKRGFRIPEWMKVVFIKFWFYGAVCYFIVWGLGMYVPHTLDMLFVTGIAMGMVVDLLLNNVLRFIEKTPRASNRWLFITKKGVIGFTMNLFYGLLVTYLVYRFYADVNGLRQSITTINLDFFIGVEPLLFGLLCTGIDMLFIGMKRLLLRIISDAKQAAASR